MIKLKLTVGPLVVPFQVV